MRDSQAEVDLEIVKKTGPWWLENRYEYKTFGLENRDEHENRWLENRESLILNP